MRHDFVRLLPDGTIDHGFRPQVSELSGVLPLGTGQLLLLGDRLQVNGVPKSGFALVEDDGVIVGGIRLLMERLEIGRVRLTSRDVSPVPWVLERSTDWSRWNPVFTNPVGERLDLVVPEITAQEFYRVAP